MLFKKLKKEIEESLCLTKDALHEMNVIFPVKDFSEEIVYFSAKRWDSLKKFLGVEKKEGPEDKDWLYNSGLIHEYSRKGVKKSEKLPEGEQADVRAGIPQLQHPTNYHKKISKVQPGFSSKSAYNPFIEPVEKKYKKKNPYRPED